MASQGNPFPRNNSTGDSYESSLFPDPNTEENREHLFAVENQVVNDLRRHMWLMQRVFEDYPLSLIYPEENTKRKTVPSWKIQCWSEIWKN